MKMRSYLLTLRLPHHWDFPKESNRGLKSCSFCFGEAQEMLLLWLLAHTFTLESACVEGDSPGAVVANPHNRDAHKDNLIEMHPPADAKQKEKGVLNQFRGAQSNSQPEGALTMKSTGDPLQKENVGSPCRKTLSVSQWRQKTFKPRAGPALQSTRPLDCIGHPQIELGLTTRIKGGARLILGTIETP